jgi:hypothetical protein
MAELLEKMVRDSHLSQREVLDRSIELLSQVADAFSQGNQVALIGKEGQTELRWATPKELIRYIERSAELNEDQ